MLKYKFIFNHKAKILINTFSMTIGNIITKFIYFFIIVYIARKYGPTFFGQFYTALNYISLLSIFTMLGFDTVIIREGAKNLNFVSELQSLFFPIRFYISLLVFFIAFFATFFVNYSSETKSLIRILSFLIFTGGHIISGISEFYGATLRIFEKMVILSIIQIIRMLLLLLLIVLLIIFNYFNFYTLAISIILSSIIYMFLIIKESNKLIKISYSFKISYFKIKKYIPPILFFGIVSILTMYGSRINIQFLDYYHGDKSVGIYSASMNIINIGIMAIGSLHIALYPYSSKNILNKNYPLKLLKYYIITFLILLIFIWILNFFLKDIIKLLFGKKYLNSVLPLSILIWILPLRFFISWGNQIIETHDLYIQRIILAILFLSINIIFNYKWIPNGSYIGAANAAFLSNFVFFIFTTIIGLNKVFKLK